MNCLQPTILRCLGPERTHSTYKFQGRDFRLTDARQAKSCIKFFPDAGASSASVVLLWCLVLASGGFGGFLG